MDNDLDELNDETFGDADIGDWEMEHEKFVMEFDAAKLPPSPRNIPKIWETTELSDFWSAGDLEVSQAYDPVLDVVESVEKLVDENEVEEPAVLNASKFGLRPQSDQITPIPPSARPSDVWSLPLSAYQPTVSSQHRFQLSNNSAAPPIDLDLLADRFKKDVSFNREEKPRENFPQLGGTSLQQVGHSWEPEKLNVFMKNFGPPPQQPKPQPLLSMPVTIPEQIQNLIAAQSPQFLQSLMSIRAFQQGIQQNLQQNRQFPGGLMSPAPSQTFNNQQFSTPPPPPLISSGPFQSPLSNSSGFQFSKPFPLSPLFQVSGAQVMQQHQFNNLPLQQQMVMFDRRPLPNLPPAPSMPQPHGARLPPAKVAKLKEIFAKRIEDVQQNPFYFDLHRGPWMTPQDQIMVLGYQLRSYNCSNTYVDDYYCTVKWLRAMTRLREARLADGIQTPQPYVFIQAPITASHLLSPDHHHRIAMRSSFIVRLVPLKKHQSETATILALPTSDEKPVSTTPTNEQKVPEQPKRPDSVASTVMTNASGLYSNQLGRPTKSNIKTQRIIADLSVATAIDDEAQKEHFRTEAEEVASMLKDPSEKKVALTTESEEAAAAMHQRNIEHRFVVSRRRRLSILARIERLYTTVLSIDETNVSLARISVRNEESKHLMGHRLLLLKVLHRDLFIFNKTQSESSEEKLDRHLAIEIFEAPKGIRVFPVILRYLFPEERAFCMSEFMSNYANVSLRITGGIDKYSQLLFNSCKDIIFKALEDSSDFARSCLRIPFSPAADSPTTSTLNELLTGRLDDNVLAMFHSSFGLSLYYCLLEACLLKNVKETVILAGELLAYASRIVSILDSNLMPLPMPLDSFSRVSEVDPAWIMRKDLFKACADLHKFAGIFRHRASAGSIAKAVPESSQTRQLQMPQYNSQQLQQMFIRGLPLA
ncbi:unnamed protein product [Hymenolepis diminuta]|uniref:PAT1 domain-containing protein n=1 Tax=Hymenolepis diminuta TaxID=6216 RepID=A0A0R3S7X5_HYMDI|nr:unnamed protein product [Hymenolepis diminuta]VUZ41381.1 unnamed protein product [Hymenolepis diminuta]